MNPAPMAGRLAREIKAVAKAGKAGLPEEIEKHLEQALQGLPPDERVRILEEVAAQFETPPGKTSPFAGLRSAESSRAISLLLGREIVRSDLSPEEISAKLAKSLNTIFDTLNQIIGTIHSTLLGQGAEEETIRQIIGSEIVGEAKDRSSLQGYLDQIQEAFLVAHRAFTGAAEIIVRQILSELDPERMMASSEGRLKFGPMRKAEFFDAYREKYQLCKNALDSGRMTEEFLREFEKACRRLYKK